MSGVDVQMFIEDLQAAPVIAIVRGLRPDDVVRLGEALAEGGVRFLETTLNSPEPFVSIRRTAQRFADAGIHVGAGTVLAPEQVERVAHAGGTYVVSPGFHPAVVRRTKELGLVSIPGFMTPSEGFAAADCGADLLKCFPASALGPAYLKAIKAVLPHPVVAVGGVNVDTAADYVGAGAVAVGVGSSIVDKQLIAEGRFGELAELARRFLAAVRDAR